MNPFDHCIAQLGPALERQKKQRNAEISAAPKKSTGRPAELPLRTRKGIHLALVENRFGGSHTQIARQFGVAVHHIRNIASRGKP
jgi:hypothetical protein